MAIPLMNAIDALLGITIRVLQFCGIAVLRVALIGEAIMIFAVALELLNHQKERQKRARLVHDEFSRLEAQVTRYIKDFGRIDEILSCPICLEKMWYPYIVRECGHCFCEGCLAEWLKASWPNLMCALCRKPLFIKPVEAFSIKNMIGEVTAAQARLKGSLDHPPERTPIARSIIEDCFALHSSASPTPSRSTVPHRSYANRQPARHPTSPAPEIQRPTFTSRPPPPRYQRQTPSQIAQRIQQSVVETSHPDISTNRRNYNAEMMAERMQASRLARRNTSRR